MDAIRVLECGTRRDDEEIEVWKNIIEFQSQALMKAMEVYKTQYDGLCLEVKDMMLRKNAVDNELKAYNRKCDGLIQRITCLEEEKKVVLERKKRESDESKSYIHQLKKAIRDLKCGKRRAEDEIEVWKKRFNELETQSALRMKNEVELDTELEAYRTQCDGLSAKLEEKEKGCVEIEGKLKGLMLRKIDVDYELNKYKKTCNGLKEQISCLDEDRKVICERERSAQERINYLEKESKKKESDEREKYVELITENRDLACGKKRAEDEINVWKKRFGELKEVMLRNISVDDELKEYKRTCNELKEQIIGLEEDQKVICEKEKRAQERIIYLEDEIKKKESDKRKKYVELVTESKDFELPKRRRKYEIEMWEKRFRDLETQVLRMKQVELEKAELEKELEILLTKYDEFSMELEEKKMECVAVEEKLEALMLRNIAVEDELKEYKRTCNGLKERILDLEEDQKVICEKERCAHERISYLEEEIKKMESDDRDKPRGLESEVSYNDKRKIYRNIKLQSETNGGTDGAHVPDFKIKEKMLNNSGFTGCNHPSLLQGNRDVHSIGPASIIMQSKPLVNVKEEKENTPLKSKVDFGSRIRKKLVTDLEGSSTKNLTLLEPGSVRPASGGIIDISDYEDKKEITPKHTCNSRGKETVHVSTDSTLKRSSDNEMDLTSKRCFKRPCSDQRGEEYWSSCEEGIPLSSTPKRTTKTLTSESESEDDDKIPICKLMMKKLEERNKGVSKLSPLNLCAGNVTLSSGGQNVEESISPSRRRLISLRQCEEKKNWWERKSRHESASPNHLRMSGISYQNAGNPSSVNGKENVAKDIGSHSEGESLGGVKWSDSSDSGDSSSDSEDATDMDLTFNQVIAMIKRNRVKESKWQFEADMLSSFEVDSELCMKAVCALYRQQISEKKLMKGSLHSNNRGFNKFDALRGTTLAEFLMDGDRKGNLKKSVKELEIFDPKALEECKRLARHYSNQLFTIYQNREDPFFLPGGV